MHVAHHTIFFQVSCQGLRMNERRSFEDALWDGISDALSTSANIDAAFDKKVLLLCRIFRVDKKKRLQLPLFGAYIFFATRDPA